MKRLPKKFLILRRATFAHLREKFGISENQLRQHLPNKLAAIQFVVSHKGYRTAPGKKLKKADYATYAVNLVNALDCLEVAMESGSENDRLQAAWLVGFCDGQFQSRDFEKEARRRGARKVNEPNRALITSFVEEAKKFRDRHARAGNRPLSTKELYARSPEYWVKPIPITPVSFYRYFSKRSLR